MLSISELSAGYGETKVIDGLDLQAQSGTITAIIGRNGMGKSTLLRSLFGVADVMGGEIRMGGHPLPPGKPEKRAAFGMSLLPDDRGVFPELTIEENLRLASQPDYECPVDVKELFPLLRERPKQAAGDLSGGQKQQLGIARAMLGGPKLICVDEFSQGLSPAVAEAGLEALRHLAEQGTAVLFVDQAPDLAIRYADRIIGMESGKAMFDVPAADVRNDSTVLTNLLVID